MCILCNNDSCYDVCMDKLLLVIDMQEGFRHPASEGIVATLLGLNEAFKGVVRYARFVDTPNSQFESQLDWRKFQNDKEQRLFREFQVLNVTSFSHSGYTVFTPELQDYVTREQIKEVYVTGIYTDVCVLKTVMDIFDAGIEVFVVADACASLHGESNHKYALDSLRHIVGKDHVMMSADL